MPTFTADYYLLPDGSYVTAGYTDQRGSREKNNRTKHGVPLVYLGNFPRYFERTNQLRKVINDR